MDKGVPLYAGTMFLHKELCVRANETQSPPRSFLYNITKFLFNQYSVADVRKKLQNFPAAVLTEKEGERLCPKETRQHIRR